jgi:hypothetical protein
MSRARPIQFTVVAAMFCAALSAGAARADTAVFRDVLKPNGHARSQAQKLTDGAACGASAHGAVRVIMPVFEKCMRTRGWVFDHYRPAASSRPRRGTNVAFTDTRGDANAHPRGDAVLQADSRACKAGQRDEESRSFKQCMATRGWQFIYAQHAPRPRVAAPAGGGWSWGTASSSSSSNLDDEARRNDEARAATQAASDAMNANNAAVAAQQAADQQQQINIINQTAPTQPQ